MVLLVVGILILAERKNTSFRIGFKNPDKQKQVKNVLYNLKLVAYIL